MNYKIYNKLVNLDIKMATPNLTEDKRNRVQSQINNIVNSEANCDRDYQEAINAWQDTRNATSNWPSLKNLLFTARPAVQQFHRTHNPFSSTFTLFNVGVNRFRMANQQGVG